MKRKLLEIQRALESELYNSALVLTLILPDICAKVEYYNTKKINIGKKYALWFDTYAKKYFIRKATILPSNECTNITLIDGKTCWALRCAVLHSGNFYLGRGDQTLYNKITLHAHKKGSSTYKHELIDGDYVEIDVINFCQSLCEAVFEYYESVSDKSLFDIDEIRILSW